MLIRVVAPHFVAGFETNGRVRLAAPILKHLLDMTDDEARAYLRRKGWTATVVRERSGVNGGEQA